jgi:hypothetical protein
MGVACAACARPNGWPCPSRSPRSLARPARRRRPIAAAAPAPAPAPARRRRPRRRPRRRRRGRRRARSRRCRRCRPRPTRQRGQGRARPRAVLREAALGRRHQGLLLVPPERERHRRRRPARHRRGRQAADPPLAGAVERRLRRRRVLLGRPGRLARGAGQGGVGRRQHGRRRRQARGQGRRGRQAEGYAPLWKAAFGDGAATAAQVTEALAAYERTTGVQRHALRQVRRRRQGRAHRGPAARPRRVHDQGHVHRLPHPAALHRARR